MSADTPILEITELVDEAGGKALHRCIQCGTCTGVCPWPAVAELSPRRVIRLASLGLEGYEEKDLWTCVTCGSCVAQCPRQIDVIAVMQAARRVMWESGTGPRAFRSPLSSVRDHGNPWGAERGERMAWARGLSVAGPDEACNVRLFTCCTQAYEPHNRAAGRALIALLQGAGVRVGLLGEQESCCGQLVRRVGDEALFEALREQNTALVGQGPPAELVTASPHCLDTLGKEYGELAGSGIAMRHHTQVLAGLLAAGRIAPRAPRTKKRRVTFHDPCYLGRHAGEYEAPRQVLGAIEGLELVEMPRSRETSLCCGAGGGGLWMDVDREQRFAFLRVEEARETGAEVLATACPYCTVMLDDAVKVMGLEDEMVVADVAELLWEAVSETDDGARAP